MNIYSLLNALPSNIAQGAIWGIMGLGLYISYKILNFSDLTVDGSFATGACVMAMLLSKGFNVYISLLGALIAGMIAGLCTGLLHTVFKIAPILSGILTQIALYSINLHILNNKANQAVSADKYNLLLSLRNVPKSIIVLIILITLIIAIMYWFFGTEIGAAIRATGTNEQMAKAQSINVNELKVLALSISNGIVALAGGLLAQFSGFADVQIGRGAIVIGLAAIIIGQVIVFAIIKNPNFKIQLLSVVIGGIIYYICIGIVLWLKLPTNDLKLFTAIIVAIFLAIPNLNLGKKGGK